jgi:hypothetical protein
MCAWGSGTASNWRCCRGGGGGWPRQPALAAPPPPHICPPVLLLLLLLLQKEEGGGGRADASLANPQDRVAAVRPMWEHTPAGERVALLTVDLDTLRAAAAAHAEKNRAAQQHAAAEPGGSGDGAAAAARGGGSDCGAGARGDECGGAPAGGEVCLGDILEEGLRRLAERDTWKVWQYGDAEFFDQDAFRAHMHEAHVPPELLHLLPKDDPKGPERPAEAGLRQRMTDLLQQVRASVSACALLGFGGGGGWVLVASWRPPVCARAPHCDDCAPPSRTPALSLSFACARAYAPRRCSWRRARRRTSRRPAAAAAAAAGRAAGGATGAAAAAAARVAAAAAWRATQTWSRSARCCRRWRPSTRCCFPRCSGPSRSTCATCCRCVGGAVCCVCCVWCVVCAVCCVLCGVWCVCCVWCVVCGVCCVVCGVWCVVCGVWCVVCGV